MDSGVRHILVFGAAAVVAFVVPRRSCAGETAPGLPHEQKANFDSALSAEILKLFAEDQKLLARFGDAKRDPEFSGAYERYKGTILKTHPSVFYDLAVKELWAADPDALALVTEIVRWRASTTGRLKTLILQNGWPTRQLVGDEAAAAVFFLFGHADTDNAWRRAQLDTIKRVFEVDHFNPRLFAHICDRIESVDNAAQIFGTVMGPGTAVGTAELYRPLKDGYDAVNLRRLQIGLPPMEADLERFRKGAKVGPYMTPIFKEWNMSEVYSPSEAVEKPSE
ncbi:DUF6624 domain-containing protein [Luteolibacter soli]